MWFTREKMLVSICVVRKTFIYEFGTFWRNCVGRRKVMAHELDTFDHCSCRGPGTWTACVVCSAYCEQWADTRILVFFGVFTSCSEEHMAASVTACWQHGWRWRSILQCVSMLRCLLMNWVHRSACFCINMCKTVHLDFLGTCAFTSRLRLCIYLVLSVCLCE